MGAHLKHLNGSKGFIFVGPLTTTPVAVDHRPQGMWKW